MSSWVLISSKDGDHTTLFQCSVTLKEKVYLCLKGISCISVWAHCFFSFYHITLRRVWLHPVCSLSLDIYIIYSKFLWAFSSWGYTNPALSPSPYISQRSTVLVALFSTHCIKPCLPCAGEPEPDIALQMWFPQSLTEGKNHPREPAGSILPNAAQGHADCLCHKDTLTAHVQLSVDQDL